MGRGQLKLMADIVTWSRKTQNRPGFNSGRKMVVLVIDVMVVAVL